MNETLQDHLAKYDVQLVMQKTSDEELRDLDADLPSDVHLVRYEEDFRVEVDAVRAYKKADIFDAYHDLGKNVMEITNGYGRIKPKLYNSRVKK